MTVAVVLIGLITCHLLALIPSTSSDDVIVDQCYDVDVRRECFQYPLNWHTSFNWAQQFCRTKDSNLVTVYSELMQRSVEQFAQFAKFGESILIGAKRLSSTQWTWTKQYTAFDGSVLNESNSVDYRVNAAIKQTTHKQLHVIARHPTDQLYYICQYQLDSTRCKVDHTHSVQRVVTQGQSCYLLYTDRPRTWHDARNKCLLTGGDLAVFDDVTSHVVTELTSSQLETPLWIGLRTSWWSWLNGDEVMWSNWSPDQPSNSSQLCIVMSSSSQWLWKAVDCSNREFVFVCQREICGPTVCCSWWCRSVNILVVVVVVAVVILYRQTLIRWFVSRWRSLRRRAAQHRVEP